MWITCRKGARLTPLTKESACLASSQLHSQSSADQASGLAQANGAFPRLPAYRTGGRQRPWCKTLLQSVSEKHQPIQCLPLPCDYHFFSLPVVEIISRQSPRAENFCPQPCNEIRSLGPAAEGHLLLGLIALEENTDTRSHRHKQGTACRAAPCQIQGRTWRLAPN